MALRYDQLQIASGALTYINEEKNLDRYYPFDNSVSSTNKKRLFSLYESLNTHLYTRMRLFATLAAVVSAQAFFDGEFLEEIKRF